MDGEEEETPGEPGRDTSGRHGDKHDDRYPSVYELVRFPWWSVSRLYHGGIQMHRMLIAMMALLLVASQGSGQIGPRMGIFFSDTEFTSQMTNFENAFEPFNAYVVLQDAGTASVAGYECGMAPSDPSVIVVSASGPNGWTNYGTGFNHIAGYITPVPVTQGGTVLSTLSLFYPGDPTVDISMGPSIPSSFAGEGPGFVGGDNIDLLILSLLSTGAAGSDVVATLNGDGVEVYGDPTPDLWVDLYVDGDNACRALTDPDATLGYDPGIDQPAAAGSRLHFPHPEWNVPGVVNFDVEAQPSFWPAHDVRTWTFEVVTELADPYQPEQVQISFVPSFDGDDGVGLNLVDRTAGITLPVLEYLEYNYTVSTSETRTFDLMVGDVDLGQRVEVGVAGYASGLRDLDNVARTLNGATDGWDVVVDVPEPAPVPGDYVNVTFHHPDWPLGPRFRADTMAGYDFASVEKVWPLRVETDQAGPVTLVFWPNFHINDAVGLVLRDPATDELFNLLPDRYLEVDMTGPVRDLELAIGGPALPALQPASRHMPASWAMIGLPLQPAPGATLNDVVLAQPHGTAYIYQLNDLGDYVQVDLDSPADRTQGYWVGATEAFEWGFYGSFNLTPVTVDLHQGWNMVGNPMWFPASVAGVQVISDGSAYTWDQAVGASLVSPSVYAYDASAQAYVPATSLLAWQGYYVRALVDDLRFVFDHEAMQIAPPLPSVGGVDDLPDALDWKVDLTLRSPAGPLQTIQLGVHPDASPGFDNRHDQPSPPRSPAGTEPVLYVSQPSRDPGPGTRFRQDLTSPNTSPYSWLITLDAGGEGQHTLTWDRRDWPVGHDLQIYRPDHNRVLVLSMLQAGSLTLDLSEGPVTLEVRTPNNAVGVGDLPAAADRLQVAPNPFNPATTLSMDLARPGPTRVMVYNARGQLVDAVELGHLPAGQHQTTWQARDRGGRDLPSGVYFAAIERDGERVGKVVKLSLVR
jgi:hypothetical protein